MTISTVVQNKSFFMVLPASMANGDVSAPVADGASSHANLKEAITFAAEDIEGHKATVIVYLCRPMVRVSNGKVVIDEIKARAPGNPRGRKPKEKTARRGRPRKAKVE